MLRVCNGFKDTIKDQLLTATNQRWFSPSVMTPHRETSPSLIRSNFFWQDFASRRPDQLWRVNLGINLKFHITCIFSLDRHTLQALALFPSLLWIQKQLEFCHLDNHRPLRYNGIIPTRLASATKHFFHILKARGFSIAAASSTYVNTVPDWIGALAQLDLNHEAWLEFRKPILDLVFVLLTPLLSPLPPSCIPAGDAEKRQSCKRAVCPHSFQNLPHLPPARKNTMSLDDLPTG